MVVPCQPPRRAACLQYLKLIPPDTEMRRPLKAQINKVRCQEEAWAWQWQGRSSLILSEQEIRQQRRILQRLEKSWIWLDRYNQDQNELKLFYKENQTRNKFQQLKLRGGKLQFPVDELAVWCTERISVSWKISNSFGGCLESRADRGKKMEHPESWLLAGAR